MAMILPEHIEEELSRWPRQWDPTLPPTAHEILDYIKHAWRSVEREHFTDPRRENCFRAFWIIGFELSRDTLLDPQLARLPAKRRAQQMIEEEGPLLFAFYSGTDEERFAAGCRDIELALRRQGEWDQTAEWVKS